MGKSNIFHILLKTNPLVLTDGIKQRNARRNNAVSLQPGRDKAVKISALIPPTYYQSP
jgi:hypothetical protein